MQRGKTGLVYDLRMTEHRCLWNNEYPECPDRFTRILDRCNELNLIERCHSIKSRPATHREILLKHTQEHYDLLKEYDGETDEQKLEEMCTHYDVFLHPSTFELSLLAVGCAIELVDKVLSGEVQNGMAIIRPPGHHAMKSSFDGFCFFNNVAIAAQHSINNYGVKRILIVDFDVHHGQGTQQLFYDDSRVLYFSIHRYDDGTHFPGLRESDFDYVGEGRGEGFNFNVALNKSGMTNSDYLAIWQQLLLPVAMEFQPELVLISAGYDAAFGCPLVLGEMEITPACYAHLVSPLMTLSEGKIAAFLEGGYNLDSLSESAAITLRTFLGDPCPLLAEMLVEPSDSVRDSILNCTQTHKAFWKCLQVHKEYTGEAPIGDQSDFHQVVQIFIDDKELNRWHNCDYYNPRAVFPNQTRSNEEELRISEHLQYLKSVTNLGKPLNRTCFASSTETTESKAKIQSFLLKHNLSGRLHGLAIDAMVQNLFEEKYLNGIYIDFEENVGRSNDLRTSIFDQNIELATRFVTEFYGLKRVLIVDFCKNNRLNVSTPTENRNILHMSLNHGDNNDILESADGFTVTIPMNKAPVSDSDYVATFQRIVMPIAYEFNPELVLMSADFDSLNGLFEANTLSADIFGYVTHWLSAVANGKVMTFTKGDCSATASCIKALSGVPLPMLNIQTDSGFGNIETIQNVISVQQKYWKSLKFNKMLPQL